MIDSLLNNDLYEVQSTELMDVKESRARLKIQDEQLCIREKELKRELLDYVKDQCEIVLPSGKLRYYNYECKRLKRDDTLDFIRSQFGNVTADVVDQRCSVTYHFEGIAVYLN